MSEENSPLRPWIDPEIEARIVALVLGEASDFEREELERMIAEDRDLAAYRERIEATHGLLEGIGHDGEDAELAGTDSDWKLPAAAQAELRAVFEGKPTDAKVDDAAVVAKTTVDSSLASSAPTEARSFGLRKTLAIAAAIIGLAVIGVLLTPSYNRVVDLTLAREDFGDTINDEYLSYRSNYSPPSTTDYDVGLAASSSDGLTELSSATSSTADSRQRARLALLAMNDSFSSEMSTSESLGEEQTKSLGREAAGQADDLSALTDLPASSDTRDQVYFARSTSGDKGRNSDSGGEPSDALSSDLQRTYAMQGHGGSTTDAKAPGGPTPDPSSQLYGDFDNGMGDSPYVYRSGEGKAGTRRELDRTVSTRRRTEVAEGLEVLARDEAAKMATDSQAIAIVEGEVFQREHLGGAERRLYDFREADSDAREGREKEVRELVEIEEQALSSTSVAQGNAKGNEFESVRATEGGGRLHIGASASFDDPMGSDRSDTATERPLIALAKKHSEVAAREESELNGLSATNESLLTQLSSPEVAGADSDLERDEDVMQRGQRADGGGQIVAIDGTVALGVGGDILVSVTDDAIIAPQAEDKVPLLGDIPVVGRIFRSTSESEPAGEPQAESTTWMAKIPTAGKATVHLPEIAEAGIEKKKQRLAEQEQLGARGYDSTRGLASGTRVRAKGMASGGTVENGQDLSEEVDDLAVRWDSLDTVGTLNGFIETSGRASRRHEAIVTATGVVAESGGTDGRQVIVVADGESQTVRGFVDASGGTGSGGADISIGGGFTGKTDSGIELAEAVMGPRDDDFTIDLNLEPEVVEFDGAINYGSPILIAKPSPVAGGNSTATMPTADGRRAMNWDAPTARGSIASDFATYQAEPASELNKSEAKKKPSPETAPAFESMSVAAIDAKTQRSDGVIRREVLKSAEQNQERQFGEPGGMALYGGGGGGGGSTLSLPAGAAGTEVAVPDEYRESLEESKQMAETRFRTTLDEDDLAQNSRTAGRESLSHWGLIKEGEPRPIRLQTGQAPGQTTAKKGKAATPSEAGVTDGNESIHITAKFVEIDEEDSAALGFDWLLEQPGSGETDSKAAVDTLAMLSWFDHGSVDSVADLEQHDNAGVAAPSPVQRLARSAEPVASPSTPFTGVAVTLGNRSGGFAVTDDSIDGLIASSAGTPVEAPASRDFGISSIRSDAWYSQSSERLVADVKDSFPVTPASPTSFSVDLITDSYGIEREFIYPTEYDPPELPSSLSKAREISKAEAPSALAETAASDEPFSTFSLHVSDVSFKLAQAALAKGEWPDAERIRIEEFVNAFDYGDPMPSQADKVACQMEQTIHPFLQQRNLLRVSMRTAAVGRSGATPLRLTLLLDHSGSMERHDRQETVRRAFALLAGQLQADDQVTLIGFARTPRLLADRVSGDSRDQLLDAVVNTPSEGGTHLESALDLAFEKALEQQTDGAQSRIILLTDGAANLGDANPDYLASKIDAMREASIAFDAAGIGAEGLNDEILEALTRKGDGRYYLLDRPEDADEGFARQIAGALRPAAMNVKVQIEFNPDRVGRYKLLGFEKHRLNKEDFRDDSVDAAEIAAEEAGVAVYQIEPLADGDGDVGTAFLRFRDMASGEMVEKSWPIPYAPDAPRPDQSAPAVRLATVASLFAAKLKGDALGDSVDLGALTQVLASLPEPMANLERVAQLRQMIEQARNLEGQ